MMRSMYSAVSGLKAHQTRMDVIGNNIANVNTVAYKSQSMTFSEVFYQTTQIASGPNAETGKGGTNAIENLQFLSWFENRCKNDMAQAEWNNLKLNIQEYFI